MRIELTTPSPRTATAPPALVVTCKYETNSPLLPPTHCTLFFLCLSTANSTADFLAAVLFPFAYDVTFQFGFCHPEDQIQS